MKRALWLLPLVLLGPPSSSCRAPTIQLFGDSTQMLAAPHWIARWGPRVTSRAVGQTDSRRLLAGTDGLNAPWPGSVTAQVVVIKHGTNDGSLGYGLTPLATYKSNLRRFVAATAAEVIFETPDPTTDLARGPIADYTAAMRDVAGELGIPLIDTDRCWRADPNWPALLYDGVHATVEGRELTVRCAAPIVDGLTCR